ncbi:MAG TPA: shikimate kinase [Pirellulales bacterium]|jgi:shikimate kinase|nr:shikimate kinase [Pirellulales bacterium]
MSIFLIGYRGTGKSTVAVHLAERLAWDWVDADAVLETEAGATIAEIFGQHGERGFRDWESAVVAKLAQQPKTVVALGGGAVLREQNRMALRGRGPVVWLTADPQTLWERILADGATAARRPNLTPHGGVAEIEQLLQDRAPWYQAVADFAIDTVNKSPAAVAHEIYLRLNSSPSTGAPA